MADYSSNKIANGSTTYVAELDTFMDDVQTDMTAVETGLSTAQTDITNIETKTDFITITQAVDLDTIETDLAASAAKTFFITVTQNVNLDTMEAFIINLGLATPGNGANLVVLEDSGGNYVGANVEEAFNELTTTTTGQGASIIGLEDAATQFVANNVEAAIAEIRTDLASTAAGKGASDVSIEDSAGVFTGTDLEAILSELGKFKDTGVTAVGTGSTKDLTGIPSWAKEITFIFDNVSHDGTGVGLMLLLGDATSFEVTGYTSAYGKIITAGTSSTATSTTEFLFQSGGFAADVYNGVLTLVQIDPVNDLWEISGTYYQSNGGEVYYFIGRKSLTGALTRVRLTMEGSTDSFDGGNIRAFYKG